MLSFAIIVFREVLEIALILGVLVAATRGLAHRGQWVWIGLIAGVIGSLIVAAFAEVISNAMEGMGQELFNAIVLSAAAILIGWTVVWMRRQAWSITQAMKQVGLAVIKGEKPFYTLAIVIGLTVLRDGSEIVMFTYGALASGENVLAVISGSLLGSFLGIGVGGGLYYGLVKISPKNIFSVTSWLLMFLAAGMASQAAGLTLMKDKPGGIMNPF